MLNELYVQRKLDDALMRSEYPNVRLCGKTSGGNELEHGCELFANVERKRDELASGGYDDRVSRVGEHDLMPIFVRELILMERNGLLSDSERALRTGIMTIFVRTTVRLTMYRLNPIGSNGNGTLELDVPMNVRGKQRLMQRIVAAGRRMRKRERHVGLGSSDYQPLRGMNRVVRKRHLTLDLDLLRNERRSCQRHLFGKRICLQMSVQQRFQ